MKRIKKGDRVVVISGKEKGKEGKVIGFVDKGQRVLVEKLNMVKRHTKPSQSNQLGGIVEKEAGIHISNVMPMTPNGQRARIQYRVDEDGKKARYCVKHDEYID